MNVRKCSNSHLFWTSRSKLSWGIKLLPAYWYSIVNSQSWNKHQVQRQSWSYSDFSLLSIKYLKYTSQLLLAQTPLKNQFTAARYARLTLSKYNPLNSKSYMDLNQLLAGPTGAPPAADREGEVIRAALTKHTRKHHGHDELASLQGVWGKEAPYQSPERALWIKGFWWDLIKPGAQLEARQTWRNLSVVRPQVSNIYSKYS